MLEPCAVKVASTVLRRGDGCEAVFLSDCQVLVAYDLKLEVFGLGVVCFVRELLIECS